MPHSVPQGPCMEALPTDAGMPARNRTLPARPEPGFPGILGTNPNTPHPTPHPPPSHSPPNPQPLRLPSGSEYLEKNYAETSGRDTLKLALRALTEVVEGSSRNIEVAVVEKEGGLRFLAGERARAQHRAGWGQGCFRACVAWLGLGSDTAARLQGRLLGTGGARVGIPGISPCLPDLSPFEV